MTRRAALVVALAATPPTVWFIHLSVTYALVPASCRGSNAWLHLTTVLGILLIGAAGVAGFLLVRNGVVASPGELVRSRDLDAERPAADKAMPRLAVLFAPYFVLLVAMGGLVFLMVDPCA